MLLHPCCIQMWTFIQVEWLMYVTLPFVWLLAQVVQYLTMDIASRLAVLLPFRLPAWVWSHILLDRSIPAPSGLETVKTSLCHTPLESSRRDSPKDGWARLYRCAKHAVVECRCVS